MAERFYITTAIMYVNDAPHIGHAYEVVIADAVARWHRLLGEDVRFVTGTDEYGLKNQQAAEAQGLDPQTLADTNSARFRAAADLLHVSYDDFIRTTEPRHTAAVQKFLQVVFDNGDIERDTYEGLYCVSCEAYYTEDELVDGNCPIHGRPVEVVKQENWFFRLSRYQRRLLDWYDEHPDAIVPATRRNEVLSFIRSGLRDISISRSAFRWGVPLPWDPDEVAWVWFDALPNYITAAGYGRPNDGHGDGDGDTSEFDYWWPADVHLIGKDIIRFHAVYWPAMLMAAGLAPPRRVAVHGWLLLSGEKISKSKLNQISPGEMVTEFGVDPVRYHLLRETPFGLDGDFSGEGLEARYNSDLANNLGNLLSRVATVVGSKCGGTGPPPRTDSSLAAAAATTYADVAAAWDRLAPSEALEATWRLIRETNAYLEAAEPWKSEPGAEVDAVLGDALEALRIVTVLVSPAVPTAGAEIWRRLGLPGSPADQRLPEAAAWGGYPGGLAVEKGPPLFPRRK
ncbi:MAG: methionyl-tRNA synthetase [Actinomycetota bacterium]|nr:methionyl-tRNA synthetase [Actinomycetota bacterium]